MTATNTLHDDLSAAYGRHLENRRANRRKLRTAAIAGVAALVVTGAALGTATLLGWPAPEHVKKEIAAVDRGLPEDLRLNPDVEHGHVVESRRSTGLAVELVGTPAVGDHLLTAHLQCHAPTVGRGSDRLGA